jgi:ectoine hydroxylase-related dioxygenase (phytanoyl-CoA dioxygenase family)
MGRGTENLYTGWTPMGDISFEQGGLMMLEHSHRLERVRSTYGQMDVDSYCENRPSGELYARGEKRWSGHLSRNAPRLREKLSGRWLTTEFRAGDLLTFGMFTIHASLDNQSDRVRLSSDSRYQLASEPADERWVGEQPMAHGPAGRRGRIC